VEREPLIGQIDGFMLSRIVPLSEAGYLSRASEAKLEMKKKHDLDFIDPFLMMGHRGHDLCRVLDEEMLNHFQRILKEDYRQKHRKALLAELKRERPSRTLGRPWFDALAKDAKKRGGKHSQKAKARKFRSLGKRGVLALINQPQVRRICRL